MSHECKYISAREGWYCPVCDPYALHPWSPATSAKLEECKAHIKAPPKYSATCGWCGLKVYGYTDAEAKEKLEEHKKYCPKRPPTYSSGCPYCGKVFTATSSEELHKKLDEHMAVCPKKPPPAPAWSTGCPYCGTVIRAYTEEELNRLLEEHKAVCPKKPVPVYTCPWCGATFDTETNLETHKAVCPKKPVEWTHKLVLRFLRLPWAKKETVEPFIDRALVPVVNAAEWLAGFEYRGKELNWEGAELTLFYRSRGSPPVTLAAVTALVAAIAALGVALGVLFVGATWLVGSVTEYKHEVTLEELQKQGKITAEQYAEYSKEAPAWEKYLPWAILGLIGLAALQRRRKKKEEEK